MKLITIFAALLLAGSAFGQSSSHISDLPLKSTPTSTDVFPVDDTAGTTWKIRISSIAVLPAQSGNAGKYLTTNGSALSWSTITGGGTGDALKSDGLEQFDQTSSLQLAGVMTDEIGSGRLVYNDGTTLIAPKVTSGLTIQSGGLSVLGGATLDTLNGGHTLATGTDAIVTTAATQTLTNKTIGATQLSGTIDQSRLGTGSGGLGTKFLSDNQTWQTVTGGGGGGITGPTTTIDNEIVLWSGTGGTAIKRATSTGILKTTSGVIGTATAGTDFVQPGATGTLTLSGSGGFGTITGTLPSDNLPTIPIAKIPTGTAVDTVAIGNDSRFPSAVTGLRKGRASTSQADIAATAGTDYVAPGGTIVLSGAGGFTTITGTLPITNIPTGTTSTTVPLGNDARFPSTLSAPGLRKTATPFDGSHDVLATANIDYLVDTLQTGTNANLTWTSGRTVFKEGAALSGSDKTLELPPTTAYADGSIIRYADNLTTVNLGRLFFPTGSDTLNGQNAAAWIAANYYKPIVAGGFAGHASEVRFQRSGTNWIAVDDIQSVDAIYKGDDRSTRVHFDLGLLDPGTDVTGMMPKEDFVAGVIPIQPDAIGAGARGFLLGITGDGTQVSDFIIGDDLPLIDQSKIQQTLVQVGNSDTTILPNNGTVSTIYIATAPTQQRFVTMPDAKLYKDADRILIYDTTGNLDATKKITLKSTSGNKFNGADQFDIIQPNAVLHALANKSGNEWIVTKPPSSGGAGIDGFTALNQTTPNVVCDGTKVSYNRTLVLNGNRTLGITGAQDGDTGTIIITHDGTGSSYTLTLPAGSYVPDNGLGVLPAFATLNRRDELVWKKQGTNYQIRLVGTNYTPLASVAACNVTGDTGGDATLAAAAIHNTGNNKNIAMNFTAAASYNLCSIDLYLQASVNGLPTNTITVYIYSNDNSDPVGFPNGRPGVVLSNSAAVDMTGLDNVQTNPYAPITFPGLNVTISSGTKYWIVAGSNANSNNATDYVKWANKNNQPAIQGLALYRTPDRTNPPTTVWTNITFDNKPRFISYHQ